MISEVFQNIIERNPMLKNKLITTFALIILFCASLSVAKSIIPDISSDEEIKYYTTGVPFDMPAMKAPVFPNKNFVITEYGAIGDGLFDNTDAINSAINKCNGNGGGHVIIPAGLWLTGPIQLKDDVDLHLEKGGMLVFTSNIQSYVRENATRGKSSKIAPPISGVNLTNIAITGEGIINGNGQYWRPVKKSKMTEPQWKSLLASGGVVKGDIWFPSQETVDIKRPYMVYIDNCTNVLLDSPTLQNSPGFALDVVKSSEIIVRNTKVMNEWWAQNGDGLDFSSCKNLLMYRCTVNAGDDGICIKSSTKWMENVVIRDCVVYHAHGGFVIGSNTNGGIRNLFVQNCNFTWTDVGLRFKSASDRGGIVENLFIQDIYMKDIQGEAILFDLTYENKVAGKGDADKNEANLIPAFRKIYMNNIYCDGAEKAYSINGTPESIIKDIHLTNAILIATKGFNSEYADGIELKDVKILAKKLPVFQLAKSTNFQLTNIGFSENADTFIKVTDEETKNIIVEKTDVTKIKTPLDLPEKTGRDAVIIK